MKILGVEIKRANIGPVALHVVTKKKAVYLAPGLFLSPDNPWSIGHENVGHGRQCLSLLAVVLVALTIVTRDVVFVLSWTYPVTTAIWLFSYVVIVFGLPKMPFSWGQKFSIWYELKVEIPAEAYELRGRLESQTDGVQMAKGMNIYSLASLQVRRRWSDVLSQEMLDETTARLVIEYLKISRKTSS